MNQWMSIKIKKSNSGDGVSHILFGMLQKTIISSLESVDKFF